MGDLYVFQSPELRFHDKFSRTILWSPPPHFLISPFLATNKTTDRKYRHGVHIFSNNQSDRSSCSSNNSSRSISEYDIWRSWEDCLWFQQSLEDEYARAAREKRLRLIQGKGIKGFNGLYKQDLASSWESLPVGPNPKSIAQDIHEYLPSLTKSGTFFGARQPKIDQRQAEFISLIEALFSDDMPTLIKEMRASTVVSDFFGCWRRDRDYAEGSQKVKTVRRDSLTSSIFSSYFLASHPTLPSSNTSPCNSPSKVPHKRSRPHSTSSDSSVQSASGSDISLSPPTSPAIVEDVPIVFGHNPNDPSNFVLEVLPEEREILSKPPESFRQVGPKLRASAMERKANRSYSIIGPSLNESLRPAEKSGDRSVRESWQTTDSQDSTANDLLSGLGLILPQPIKEQKFRASIASISTFLTTNSADAVIPQTPTTATASQSSSFTSRTAPLTLSNLDAYSDEDSYSVLDAFPCLNFSLEMGLENRPGSPMDDLSLFKSPSSTCTAFNLPGPETCSILTNSAFSETSSASFPIDSICIKAIHGTCIILLRVSREIGLADLRRRLYNKLVAQEGIPLSETYKIAYVSGIPAPLTSASSQSVAPTDGTEMQLITLESDWEKLISTFQGSKIILRILDGPSI